MLRADPNKSETGNDIDLSFKGLPEYERTRHVHRLHPYLGKFIPQLVEFFLKRYFRPGSTVLDPFVGSGTTLVEANALDMNSIGVDVSEFNCLISRVKTMKYDLDLMETEVKSILKRTKGFSKALRRKTTLLDFSDESLRHFDVESEYLQTWFSRRALQELLYYRSLIDDYEYKDLLKVILSRSSRSSRLVPHYELTRAEAPILEPYYCHKHSRICAPVQEAIRFLRRYSLDSMKRIKEFAERRTDRFVKVIAGDSRTVRLSDTSDGIFTSPPYVGLIDYHEQHRYAYELLGLPVREELEVGRKSEGQSETAIRAYEAGMIEAFGNMKEFLKEEADIFIVVNDKFDLFREIGAKTGMDFVREHHREVTKKASRERRPYEESIFHFRVR